MLWESLQQEAGLELSLKHGKGRDADLEAAVLKRLHAHLALPKPPGSVQALLLADTRSGRPRVTAELLLLTVLASMGGFASMMTEILETLLLAKAPHASQSLSIAFKFDEQGNDAICCTLREFRAQVKTVKRTVESRLVVPSSDALLALLNMLEKLGGRDWKPVPDFPLIAAPPSSGHRQLDAIVADLNKLVSDFRSWCLEFGLTRKSAYDRARERYPNNNISPGREAWGITGLAMDYWDMRAAAALGRIADRVARGELDGTHVAETISALSGGFERHRRWADQTYTQLLDVLHLPAWRKRHELYSVWAGTVLLRTAVENADTVQFHPVNGILSFSFGGSRLATYVVQGQQYDVWAELRSALVGTSKKRTKGIQPDFRVVRPNLAASIGAATEFILECKHYLVQGRANFVAAAKDYARSCPTAKVFVINHGPADDVSLAAECDKLAPGQVRFFGDATVEQEIASKRLKNAIKSALFRSHTPVMPTPEKTDVEAGKALQDSAVVAMIKVAWDDSLHDIDLSLRMRLPGYPSAGVNYDEPGDLFSTPYARLKQDVRIGPGEEVIKISAWHFHEYEILVSNFTDDVGRLAAGHVRCEVIIGGHSAIIDCPDLGNATEWRVGKIICADGSPRLHRSAL
jgi:hypothetical protein